SYARAYRVPSLTCSRCCRYLCASSWWLSARGANMSLESPMASSTTISDRRADFPILKQTVRGQRLVYLDNGATTQKPQVVIDAEREFYEKQNANIHRGVHWLSQHATDLYDQ